MHGLDHALGLRETSLHTAGFIYGITGTTIALGGMGWVFTSDWPLNIGGKPTFPLPAFIPITFELTVLGAALTAFGFSLGLSGLPKPYHPMFNLPEFERASQDRFFLCIEADDKQFEEESTRQFLESLAPLRIAEVPQ